MKKRSKQKWITKDEIKWLKKLREEKLRSYYRSIPLRIKWGDMDKEKIIDFCILLARTKGYKL